MGLLGWMSHANSILSYLAIPFYRHLKVHRVCCTITKYVTDAPSSGFCALCIIALSSSEAILCIIHLPNITILSFVLEKTII